MAADESWKGLFSKQFPHKRPIWDRKIKMCARWHIKGNCYDNCTQVASHVTKDKILAKKKESYLTFILKYHETAKRETDCLGWDLAAPNPQRNHPKIHSYLVSTSIQQSQTSIDLNHSCQPRWKNSPFCHGKIHQHQHQTLQVHGSQRQYWQHQEQQGQQRQEQKQGKSID